MSDEPLLDHMNVYDSKPVYPLGKTTRRGTGIAEPVQAEKDTQDDGAALKPINGFVPVANDTAGSFCL
jgi:hypothetical protein